MLMMASELNIQHSSLLIIISVKGHLTPRHGKVPRKITESKLNSVLSSADRAKVYRLPTGKRQALPHQQQSNAQKLPSDGSVVPSSVWLLDALGVRVCVCVSHVRLEALTRSQR